MNLLKTLWRKNQGRRPKLLSLILPLLLVGQTVFLDFRLGRRSFLKEHPHFDAKAPLRANCLLAMKAILKHHSPPELFHERIVRQMNREGKDLFDFAGKERVYDVIVGPKENRCTVILSDRLGNRFFKFLFQDSSSSEHLYGRVIKTIQESPFYDIVEAQ